MANRPINVIAREIQANWFPVHFSALPYLRAMYILTDINDDYGMDDARGIIMYFLANAQTWRGETARRIKAELNQMLKS